MYAVPYIATLIPHGYRYRIEFAADKKAHGFIAPYACVCEKMRLHREGNCHEAQPSQEVKIKRDDEPTMTRHNGTVAIIDIQIKKTAIE